MAQPGSVTVAGRLRAGLIVQGLGWCQWDLYCLGLLEKLGQTDGSSGWRAERWRDRRWWEPKGRDHGVLASWEGTYLYLYLPGKVDGTDVF